MGNLAGTAELNLRHRIPEIDGLRGIAIGLVIVWHYFTVPLLAQSGSALKYFAGATSLSWTGVDLFFVLSGFLIGGILLDARNSSNYFRVFYARRFFRIVPIYAVVLLLTLGMHVHLHPGSSGIASSASDRVAPWYMYWTFTQNFWMAAASTLGTNTLGMTWSLAVEEQFYLALPLIIYIFSGRQLRKIILLGIVTAPLLRIFMHFASPDRSAMASFVLMPCRADALLLGVFAAILLRDANWRMKIQNSKRYFVVALSILVCGLVALILRKSSFSGPLMTTFGYSWVALFYVNVLLYAVTRPGTFLGSALRMHWLRWIGSIAYGTYLLHEGVQRFVFRHFSLDPFKVHGAFPLFLDLVALVLCLTVAHFSWTLFEKPLVKMGHQTDYAPATQDHPVGYASATD